MIPNFPLNGGGGGGVGVRVETNLGKSKMIDRRKAQKEPTQATL